MAKNSSLYNCTFDYYDDDDGYSLNVTAIGDESEDLESLFNTIGRLSRGDHSGIGMAGPSSSNPLAFSCLQDPQPSTSTAFYPNDSVLPNVDNASSDWLMSGPSLTTPWLGNHGATQHSFPFNMQEPVGTDFYSANNVSDCFGFANGGYNSQNLMDTTGMIDGMFTGSVTNRHQLQDNVEAPEMNLISGYRDVLCNPNQFTCINEPVYFGSSSADYNNGMFFNAKIESEEQLMRNLSRNVAVNCENLNIGPYFGAEGSKAVDQSTSRDCGIRMCDTSDKKQLVCVENEKPTTSIPPKSTRRKTKVKKEDEKSTSDPPKSTCRKRKVKTEDEKSTSVPCKSTCRKTKVKTEDEKSASIPRKSTCRKTEVKTEDEKSTSIPAKSTCRKTKVKAVDEKSTIPSQEVLHQKPELPLPDNGLAVSLLRHQRIALSWMSKKETKSTRCCGGILADDQGLGKTVSTIALILKERSPPCSTRVEDKEIETLNLDQDENTKNSGERKSILPAGTLIVCPTSVLRQWNDELQTKVMKEAHLSVLVYHGVNRTKDPFEVAKYDVVITTYAIVSMEVPKQPLDEDDDDTKIKISPTKKRKYPPTNEVQLQKPPLDEQDDDETKIKISPTRKRKHPSTETTDYPLAKLRWFRVVLDEAQSIKNYKTQVARACWGLKAKRRWCLSGTPIQNSVDDLYSYFRFLKYEPFAVFKSFCTQIKAPIQKNPVAGYKRLQMILKTIMVRRTKGSLLKGEPIISLPPKTVILKRVDFSPEERHFYRSLEAESRAMFAEYAAAGTLKQNYVNILLMLLRLRQACDHPFLVRGCKSSIDWRLSVEKAKQLPQEKLNRLLNCLEASLAVCSICNDPPEDAVVTTCEHVFCNQCILEHLSSDDSHCPFSECKSVLNRSSIYCKSALTVSVKDCGSEEVKATDRCVSNEPVDSLKVEAAKVLDSSKIKAAIEVLQSIAKPQDGTIVKEKAIVFSQWTGMLDLFEVCLKDSSIGYRRLDGTMSVVAREKAVKDFNTLPEVTVIIMSLKAASLGLNMVAANHVILLDLWWNPTIEDQAIDRAHRIGQTRPVTVLRFTVKDTVEDRILALQEKKREMVASAFGEDEKGGSQTRLTLADMEYLFQS